jgi:ribosomal protein L7/L12
VELTSPQGAPAFGLPFSDHFMSYCPFCQEPVSKSAGNCPHCGAFLGEDDHQKSPDYAAGSLTQRVFDLIRQHRKLEAIKLYKDETGAGLWEAKEAVEAIERGQSPGEVSPHTKPFGDAALESEIVNLLRQQAPIQAIRRYRESTGGSLRDAKIAVDAIARRHGLRAAPSGCAVTLVTVAVIVGLAAGIIAAVLAWG